MNLTTGDRSRYESFPSHLIPRTRLGRRVVGLYIVLFLCAQWPIVALANRDEPTVFGLPFLFVFLAVVYAAKILLLIYAARRQL